MCSLCLAITYADGYPTTQSETIRAIVQRPEGIAEDSSITCGLSDCVKCRVFTTTPCKKLSIDPTHLELINVMSFI